MANNVIRATLTTSPSAVCGITGTHIGSFRVKARIWASSANVQVRLSYADGSGIYQPNDYALPPVNGAWAEVDLGTVTIDEALAGTQQWTGRVEAIGAAGDTVDIDYLILIPVSEGYGKARGAYTYTAGSLLGRDEFTSITAGGALNTRSAPSGGAWATSGAATDFTFADAPAGSDETITRATTSDSGSGRFAILGATTYTDVEVSVASYRSVVVAGGLQGAVIARYVDSSNYLEMAWVARSFIAIRKVVAGVVTQIASNLSAVTLQPNTWYSLRLVAFASGVVRGALLDGSGAVLSTTSGSDSALATGGVLATGKVGIRDVNGATASTRYYDNFYVATPAPEPVVIYSGRSAQIRHDDAIRYDSTGIVMGKVPAYTGARFTIPPAGDLGLASRVLVKANRDDVDVGAATSVTDSTSVQVAYTPRYLLPR